MPSSAVRSEVPISSASIPSTAAMAPALRTASGLSIIATTSTALFSAACASALPGALKPNTAGGPPQLRCPIGG